MSAANSKNLLLLGKVIGPHGVGGFLRIWSYAQSEEDFLRAGSIFLKMGSGEIHEHTIVSVRPHKNIYLLKLRDLNSSDEAEKYRGAEILIQEGSLKREDQDEYFWHELIGLRVYLNTGRYIGILSHVLETGSNDIYVIREGEREIFIPGIHDVVEKIDLSSRKMIVSEMEGLFDLNEV